MASNPVEILEHILRIHSLFGDANKVLRQLSEYEAAEAAPEPTSGDHEQEELHEQENLREAIPDLDPYALLGLRRGAPDAVVDAAFKALAKKFHPDAGGSEEAMRQLSEAYHRIKEDRK